MREFKHKANPNAGKYFAMLDGPKQSETLLQKHLCLWMSEHYPGIIFESGMQGFHLSYRDAEYASIINSHPGMPDLKIYEPRGPYCGMALELKKEGAKLYKKDGSLCKDDHLAQQAQMLRMLSERGWHTTFAQGLEQAKQLITRYLSDPENCTL